MSEVLRRRMMLACALLVKYESVDDMKGRDSKNLNGLAIHAVHTGYYGDPSNSTAGTSNCQQCPSG